MPGPAQRLIVAENTLENETKYFLSNAPDDVDLKEILCVAFSRWHIEQLFREGKSAVGLDEYQVRSYRSLMRHLILSDLSVLFLAEETETLRGEKPLVVGVPGSRSGGTPAGSEEASQGADPIVAEDSRPNRLPAASSR